MIPNHQHIENWKEQVKLCMVRNCYYKAGIIIFLEVCFDFWFNIQNPIQYLTSKHKNKSNDLDHDLSMIHDLAKIWIHKYTVRPAHKKLASFQEKKNRDDWSSC